MRAECGGIVKKRMSQQEAAKRTCMRNPTVTSTSANFKMSFADRSYDCASRHRLKVATGLWHQHANSDVNIWQSLADADGSKHSFNDRRSMESSGAVSKMRLRVCTMWLTNSSCGTLLRISARDR